MIIASRNFETGEAVAVGERAAGHSVTAEHLDQGDEKSILALRDRIRERFGILHGLVNNAVAHPLTNSEESARPEWEDASFDPLRPAASPHCRLLHHRRLLPHPGTTNRRKTDRANAK